MATLYLVRHGQAAASWDEDPDPGLNDLGHQQAAELAARMAPLGPLAWNTTVDVVDAVREIPSPTEDLSQRRTWLKNVMAGTWAEADSWLHPWRQGMIDTLLELRQDTVIVSHFVAINVAVGAAQNDERLTLFRPNNCSVTVLETDGQTLSVVELGEVLETVVN